jgi:VWFA-related protein
MKAQKTLRNFNIIVITLGFLFAFIAFSKISYAQDDVIRVKTNLVTIPATVLDRDGRFVTNLRKEDFQIFENGIEQEIALFEPVEKECTVLILLDVSGSMSYHLAELADSASIFVNQLRPDDQLITVSFGEDIELLTQRTKVKDLKKGIKLRPMSTYRNTMVYDAVEFALKKMKKIRGRKAIVLFSDGVGSGLSASAKSNLRDAEEQESLIYTMQFTFSPPTPSGYVNTKKFNKWAATASNYMRDLAQKTGGRHYRIEDIADLDKTFGLVGDELGRQYSLGYYPKQLEAGQKRQVRQIKVKVHQPNLIVKARESYVVEAKK